MTSRKRVCVIGGGISGLSSALQILEAYPFVDITIIAEKFSPETTSDGAGGLWLPFLVGDTKADLIDKWSISTYNYLLQLHQSEEAEEAGLHLMSGFKFFQQKMDSPSWASACFGFRHATQREIKVLCQEALDGWYFTTFMLPCTKYLPWLQKRIQKRGGKLIKGKVESLQELAGKYDIVINCSGLGSYHLVGDKDLIPIRGQIIRVKSSVRSIFLTFGNDEDFAHILPLQSELVLGGVARKGSWDTSIDVATRDAIMQRCCKLLPSLKYAEIVQEWAGLRPFRSKGVRLEREIKHFGPHKLHVIHNYGHSGSGITLHWGCAEDVVQLFKESLHDLHQSRL